MPNRLLKDSFLYGAADFVSKGFAALLFPLFTRYLSVSDFGILALITVVSSMVSMLVECGLNNAVQLLYFEKRFQENTRVLVTTGLFLQAVLGVLIVAFFLAIIYPWQGILLSRYLIHWEWLVLSMLIVIPNLLIRYCLNITRLHYKPLIFGVLSLFANLFWMFLAIHLMKNEAMGISGYFLANLVLLVILLPFSVYAIKRDIQFSIDRKLGVEVLKLGVPFIFSNVAFWLFGSIDRWLLAEYSDTVQVGLYSVAYKIAVIAVMVNAAFSQAWSPLLLKIIHEDIQGGMEYIAKVSRYYLAFLSIVCLAITLFSKEVLELMTPEAYWPASLSVGLISLAIFINGTTQFTLIGISIRKKTLLINYASWIAVVVNIVFNIILSRYMGAVGASLAMVVTYIFLSFFYNYFSKRVFDFSLPVASFLLPSLLLIAANVYVLFAQEDPFNWLAIFIKASFILLLSFFYLKYFKIEMKDIVKTTVL